jgi:hypothetical protein
MKTIISGALAVTAVAVCLTLNVQAKSITPANFKVPAIAAATDTGKMAKAKMKMAKKKMVKMEKGKMDKMKKDTAGKM